MVADFGSSHNSNNKFLTTVKYSKTKRFASIEQLNEEDAHRSFDIWALGIILYFLMAKKVPYDHNVVSKLSMLI